MARNTSLFLRIGEAKNLPVKDLVSGTSDPYCVIKVDNEEIARTATVWKSLCPFWGEEYTLHLPNGFHQVSIYVYDEDVMSDDDLIGSVQLSRDTITCEPKGVEKWFPLSKVVKDQEVKGEIHLDVNKCTYNDRHVIKVKVIEARDLAVKDTTGTSDLYVVVSVDDLHVQTQTIRGSLYPTWDETFDLEIPVGTEASSSLLITVWDWDRVGDDDFMGQVEFKLDNLKHNIHFKDWFRLLPKHSERPQDTVVDNQNMGTIRIRGRLTEERILPSEYYQPLLQVLMDSVSPDLHTMTGPSPLKMLQEVMTLDLMELANTLVKLYLGQGKVTVYLDVVCSEEVRATSNPNTLFRGNSLATKSVDQFMKLVAMPYLHETLGGVIEQIYQDKKACELDPNKLDWVKRRHSLLSRSKADRTVIQDSTSLLLRYLTSIKDSIMASIPRMPPVMRLVFKTLRERIEEQWPGTDQEDRKYVGVSGFLFLRFLAPAILSPKLFSLQNHHPDATVSRTLTLLAKAIQSMGNLGLQIGQGKEQWMEPLHPFIRGSVTDIKLFIDQVTDIQSESVICDVTRRRSIFHPNITIKQGFLHKIKWCSHGQGQSHDKVTNITRASFKKRFFWLKFDQLVYAKKQTDQVRTTLLTQQIYAIERVDKAAFKKPNVGQVVLKNLHGNTEILYILAKDINDLHSWISSIRKTVITNVSLLDKYHAGVYKHGKWTCCFKVDVDAEGCSRTHSQAVLGDWRDPLDPDVEAQTIYSQLLQGRHVLRQKHLETTEAVKQTLSRSGSENREDEPVPVTSDLLTVDSGSVDTLRKSTSFQDAQIGSVAQLLDVICDLEKAHEVFDKMEQEERKVKPHQTDLAQHRRYAGVITGGGTTEGCKHSPRSSSGHRYSPAGSTGHIHSPGGSSSHRQSPGGTNNYKHSPINSDDQSGRFEGFLEPKIWDVNVNGDTSEDDVIDLDYHAEEDEDNFGSN